MKYNISSCGKATIRLYFESKAESKKNQNMNIEIIFGDNVDNCYHPYVRDKSYIKQ